MKTIKSELENVLSPAGLNLVFTYWNSPKYLEAYSMFLGMRLMASSDDLKLYMELVTLCDLLLTKHGEYSHGISINAA